MVDFFSVMTFTGIGSVLFGIACPSPLLSVHAWMTSTVMATMVNEMIVLIVLRMII
jgi:hypothetical protein